MGKRIVHIEGEFNTSQECVLNLSPTLTIAKENPTPTLDIVVAAITDLAT